MMFQGSLNLLLRAERKLGIEGLVLLLQCDGSGCIRDGEAELARKKARR